MHQQTWTAILAALENTVDSQRLDTWIKPLRVQPTQDPAVLTLSTDDPLTRDFLDQHYRSHLLEVARSRSDTIRDISFVVATSADDLPCNAASVRSSTPLPVASPSPYPNINKRFSFESFVVGSGNEFAKSAALAVAEAPGKTKFNPLLIYGGVGLGKTHLLQAIGNYALSLDSDYRLTYVTSEEFYLNFIDAIKNNSTKTFTERFRSSDLLLLDDVHFLAGKESTQEEFFFIFNTLYQNGRQIVLTSDRPPASLQGLQDRLVSRFQWGLCVDIQPPDLETRVAILKKKAEEDNLNMPQDVLYHIAESVSSNIRELEGVVIRLLAYASITKHDITIELVRNVLRESQKREKPRITIDEIIEQVSHYYHIPVNNMREKNRRKEVAHARQVAMYIAKLLTDYSLKSIGLNFGGRDHSTVIYALSAIEQQRKDDASLAKDIHSIVSTIESRYQHNS
jgi:chromosomal replication initiator protein